MGGNGLPPDYARLEQLSTEELTEMIRADADSAGRGNENIIFAVLEVLEERIKGQPDYRPVEIGDAWESFQRYYNTPDGDGLSLFPAEDAAGQDTLPEEPRRAHRRARKMLALTAAALAVLLAGVLAAQAMGIAVFGVIARWTDEILHFEGSAVDTSAGADWAAALIEQSEGSELIPAWIPDGFEAGEMLVDSYDTVKVLRQSFENSQAEVYCIEILIYSSPDYISKKNYEKDAAAVEEYQSGDRTIYLFSNLKQNTAVCWTGLTEITVMGDIPSDSLRQIIESIGGQ